MHSHNLFTSMTYFMNNSRMNSIWMNISQGYSSAPNCSSCFFMIHLHVFHDGGRSKSSGGSPKQIKSCVDQAGSLCLCCPLIVKYCMRMGSLICQTAHIKETSPNNECQNTATCFFFFFAVKTMSFHFVHAVCQRPYY